MLKLHVMYADGDPRVRDLIAHALRPDSFFVARSCASGGEALKTALEWRPDLVLLDVALPDIDGSDILARLRADRRAAFMPVVLMTAQADEERARLLALGAAGVIEKPFDTVGLAGELRRFVPIEGVLKAARRNFMRRLEADASALSACRRSLSKPALARINAIAHKLAGAGGIYGFAGITSESAALCDLAENGLAGRARHSDVVRALDRLLRRIDTR